ncbi:MAG: S1 RNA-binding domain-containing protein, partial [Planctomycetales bacterium]|nr:S1 RNA-binding domain-containing protein [Planctomycetales bacterium]
TESAGPADQAEGTDESAAANQGGATESATSVAPIEIPDYSQMESTDVDVLSQELQLGKLLVQDIVDSLRRPGRDPRQDLPPPVFRRGIMKLDDLTPEMELQGTVLNVVDFGAFVDIGLTEPGLVHISRLADRYVKDPHELVAVGDALRVWVVEVDKKRRRVSLTAIKPGTKSPRHAPRHKPADKSAEPQGQQRRGAGKRGGQKRGGASGTAGGGQKRRSESKRPAKPVVPITQAMKDGQEPMRTFSDLLQFYEQKEKKPKPKK